MTSPGTLETHLYDNNDRRPIEPVSRERRPVSSSENPATMPSLISLPNEIVHNILTFVDPSDLGRVPRTCRALRRFVEGDGQLWKDVYSGNLVRSRASSSLLACLVADEGGGDSEGGIFG